jgi:hypothetical protein
VEPIRAIADQLFQEIAVKLFRRALIKKLARRRREGYLRCMGAHTWVYKKRTDVTKKNRRQWIVDVSKPAFVGNCPAALLKKDPLSASCQGHADTGPQRTIAIFGHFQSNILHVDKP